MSKKKKTLVALLIGGLLLMPAWQGAEASLNAFQSFVGHVGVSTDGFGSTGQSGILTANVPAGSTVLGAYLYTSTFFNGSLGGVGGAFQGTPVVYGSLGLNAAACCSLTAARTDVTAIAAPIINVGPGGAYNFTITETSSSQDGEALVVVYSNPALPEASVGILDGFALVTGDHTSINFADPLNPAAPGFFAEMRLGIGFSCCGQESTVKVNGVTITTHAGNNDDGLGSISNGQLFTMGGDDDPFSPFLPSYAEDHERYNLVAQIANGDTSIGIDTFNSSKDDNIFVAVFFAAGVAGFNEPPPPPCQNPPCVPAVPEPASLVLLGVGLVGAAAWRRRYSR